MSYFTSKDETPAGSYWREKIKYNVLHEKMIYIDMGYKSAQFKNQQVT